MRTSTVRSVLTLAAAFAALKAGAAPAAPSRAATNGLAPAVPSFSASGPDRMAADSGALGSSAPNTAPTAPAPAPAAADAAPPTTAPAASSAAPEAPALDPEPPTRETRRRARIAERDALIARRDAIRAERLERRAVIQAARDSCRRLDNFYVGAGLVSSQYTAFAGSDSEATETSAPIGIWFGYRMHFARTFGYRIGGLAHFGPTEVERNRPDPYYPMNGYGYHASGSRGMTGEIDASAQMILGPFGRFAIEPGVFYGFGWHTAKSIPLDDGYAGLSYEPRPRYSVAGGMLGISLFLGNRDQFCPTGLLSLGKALGSADAMVFTAGLGFTFAFQDG